MSNFELIDDYLTDRLGEAEKEGFEKQLESDPALKADVDLQRHILKGIKSARATQLKSMLNNVPVGEGLTVQFSLARMAASLIGVGIIGAALYFYLRPGEVPDLGNASADFAKKSEQLQKKQEQDAFIPADEAEPIEESLPAEKDNDKPKVNDRNSNPPITPSENKPSINVADPTEELTESKNEPATSEHHKGTISVSQIDVETDTANKRYTFHYQFASGKLFLYGPFDRNLYEILEINSDRHTVFLFYKEDYYLLNERQIKITPLEPITDEALVKKLKEYRSK